MIHYADSMLHEPGTLVSLDGETIKTNGMQMILPRPIGLFGYVEFATKLRFGTLVATLIQCYTNSI